MIDIIKVEKNISMYLLVLNIPYSKIAFHLAILFALHPLLFKEM